MRYIECLSQSMEFVRGESKYEYLPFSLTFLLFCVENEYFFFVVGG
jgi:hypothetical protein